MFPCNDDQIKYMWEDGDPTNINKGFAEKKFSCEDVFQADIFIIEHTKVQEDPMIKENESQEEVLEEQKAHLL